MYEAIVNLLDKLNLTKYAKFVLSQNELFFRIWLEFMIMRCRRQEILLKHIIGKSKRGSVIYDIGASVGIYSIVCAQIIPNSIIYAFEPNYNTYARLLKNVKIKG